MKRGAHLLAPGPAGVEGRFGREIMSLLYGSVLGDKAQERERVHPCNVPHKPALNTCRSRCQQMSTPLLVLLKADPRLEGEVADDKADPLVFLQTNQIFVLQYCSETAGSMDHQHVLR